MKFKILGWYRMGKIISLEGISRVMKFHLFVYLFQTLSFIKGDGGTGIVVLHKEPCGYKVLY